MLKIALWLNAASLFSRAKWAVLLHSQLRTKWASLRSHFLPLNNIQWRRSGVISTAIFLLQHLRHIITIRSTNSHNVSRLQPRNNPMFPPTSAEKQSNKPLVSFHHSWINPPTRGFFQAFFRYCSSSVITELQQTRRRRKRKRHLKIRLRVSEIIFQLFKVILLEKRVLTILELNWNQRMGHKKTKLNLCHNMLTSSTQLQNRSFHVVERTRTSSKCQKMRIARAKRVKILFFIVKYTNLWGFCCRRRLGCLRSLITAMNLKIITYFYMSFNVHLL